MSRTMLFILSSLFLGAAWGAPAKFILNRVDLLSKALVLTERDVEAFMASNVHVKQSQLKAAAVAAEEEEEAGAFLLCVPLATAGNTVQFLRSSLRGAETIYTSKAEDAACFVAFDVPDKVSAAAAEVAGEPHLLVPIPAAAKVSPAWFRRGASTREDQGTDGRILSSAFLADAGTPEDGFAAADRVPRARKYRGGGLKGSATAAADEKEGANGAAPREMKPALPRPPRRATDGLTVTFAPGFAPSVEEEAQQGAPKVNSSTAATRRWFARLLARAAAFDDDSDITPRTSKSAVERKVSEETGAAADDPRDSSEAIVAAEDELWFARRLKALRRDSAQRASAAAAAAAAMATQGGSKTAGGGGATATAIGSRCDFSGLELVPALFSSMRQRQRRGGGAVNLNGLGAMLSAVAAPVAESGAQDDDTAAAAELRGEHCVLRLVAALAADPAVLRVAPQPVMTPNNHRITRWGPPPPPPPSHFPFSSLKGFPLECVPLPLALSKCWNVLRSCAHVGGGVKR